MNKDVSFEELEATAFEFAKAQSTGTGVDISKKSMELAEKWHAEAALRESLYHAKRAVWEKIDRSVDYADSDLFISGEAYWVIRENDNKPMIAYFADSTKQRGSIYAMFHAEGDEYVTFTISHYLPKEIGDKIMSETRPPLPAGMKKVPVALAPIPVMKTHW